MDAHRRRRAIAVSRGVRPCRRRSGRAGGAQRSRLDALSRGSPMRSCATSRARRGHPRRLRSARRRHARLARPALAPTYGENRPRDRAHASRGADARSQRQERSRGLGGAPGGPCCRPARCASTRIRRFRSWRAMPTANGGCRTRRPRCPPGCSTSPGCASSISAPRRAARPPSSPPPAPGLIAVDRSAERLKRLAANLARLQLNAELVVGDALTFDAPPFDPPCRRALPARPARSAATPTSPG